MRFFCIFFLFLANDAFAQITPGKPLSNDIVIKSSNELFLIKAGVITKKYVVILDNIHYGISLDSNKNVEYIETSDLSFKTSDSLSIGMEFKEINNAKIDNIKTERGWAKYILLESGWNAAFDFKGDITSASKILFFFKRK